MDTLYRQAYQTLLAALGHVTTGGALCWAAHIGATSVPDLAAHSPLDLLVVIEPSPLTQTHLAALQTLGYEPLTPLTWSAAQPFQHRDGHHLFVQAWEDERCHDQRLLRAFLNQSAAARHRYLAAKTAAGPGEAWKDELFPTLIQDAEGWWIAHDNFATLHRLLADLATLPRPWYIASGWALDLFLGEVTRFHEDVDVVVARQDQLVLQQHLGDCGWRWVTPLAGKLEPWPPHMRIELPRHQAHAHRLQDNGEHDFIDFLITDFQQEIWRYRREPSIVQTVERAVLTTADGIRYLAPELVLLFKSRNTGTRDRSKDQADFERVLPRLDPPRRAWLRWALLVTQPNHAWLNVL